MGGSRLNRIWGWSCGEWKTSGSEDDFKVANLPSRASGTDVTVRLWHSRKSNYWEAERHSEATSHCALGQSIPWAVERWAMEIARAKRGLYLP